MDGDHGGKFTRAEAEKIRALVVADQPEGTIDYFVHINHGTDLHTGSK